MAYKHGISASEIPTSLLAPVQVESGIPVVFGTAPVNLSKREVSPVNEPILCYTYGEAVEAMGYSEDWEKYTLCEFIYSHFSLFQMAPIILINVLNPSEHTEKVDDVLISLTKGSGILEIEGVLKESVSIKTEGSPSTIDKNDYILSFNSKGHLVITLKSNTPDVPKISVSFEKLTPSSVKAADIVGGVDVETGKYTGLELVNQVFPRYRLVPGQILAPGFSHDSMVAAVMKAKSLNINGHFKCVSLVDIPTDKVKKYTDAPAWKNEKNIVSERQFAFYPKVSLGDKQFHLSTQVAGLICQTNAKNDGVPYVSPSNKSLQADGAVLKDGTPMFLGPEQANYLNSQGIVTALNFTGGWVAWGNETSAYPSNTDPKDCFIPVRNMFDWLHNTIILTYWQKIDGPIHHRLIESITDSINLWLNGLTAKGYLLGGRVEFLKQENPLTDLIGGIIQFHLFATPPTPAKEIKFLLEFDPTYFNSLFAA